MVRRKKVYGRPPHRTRQFECSCCKEILCEDVQGGDHLEASPVRSFWGSLSETIQGEDARTIGCPSCGKELVQCLHCSYNFCPDDMKSIRQHHYGAMSYYKMWHYKNYHGKRGTSDTTPAAEDGQEAAKRQRQTPEVAAGCDEDGEDRSGNWGHHSFDSFQGMECASVHSDAGSGPSCGSLGGGNSIPDMDTWVEEEEEEEDAAEDAATEQMFTEDDDFANQFNDFDLEPSLLHVEPQTTVPAAGGELYSFSDFNFLDTREEEEKKARANSDRMTISPIQLYFWQSYQGRLKDPSDGTGGFAGLVHRSSARGRGDPFRTAVKAEAHQTFILVTLLLNLSGNLKDMLIAFQANLFQLFGIGSIAHGVETKYPTNMADANSMLLRGPNSLMKNFPSPKVFGKANHACVDLKETIILAAAHGAEFNFAFDPTKPEACQRNEEGLNGTEAASDLIKDVREAMDKDPGLSELDRKSTSIGWIYFWSDSFLRCFVRQRENSVWILTVTICPPEKEKSTGKFTHVLAIGKSSEDHTPVIEFYLEECMKLMKGFKCYFGATNQIRRMAVSMLTWNADRPERQGVLNTRKEGTYGKISGYAANVDQDKFPACHNCYLKLLKAMTGQPEENSGPCSQCFNWTITPDSPRQVRDWTGSDYPTQPACQDEPVGREAQRAFIGPLKLSADFLVDVLKKAYHARQQGIWSKPNLAELLRTCNVGGGRVAIVDQIAEEDCKEGRVSAPERYLPKIWSLFDCFDRYRLPDLPMHGIGHGIVPDVMDIVHQIFIHHRKLTAFTEFANETLSDIAIFRLDYCKVKTLPKAGWICENMMSFARLMPYLYGRYLLNNPLSGANENEARVTVDNIKCMLNAFQAMMSVLMSKRKVAEDKDEAEEIINNHMKLFMSTANHLHKTYGSLGRAAPSGAGGAKGSNEDAVKNLAPLELKSILADFDIQPRGSASDMKKQVGNIGVAELAGKLENMGEDSSGDKPVLQKRLFEKMTNRKLCKASPKTEDMCWNRGNWLSFLANIAGQISYLGALTLIW
jgi:hypothetical protein